MVTENLFNVTFSFCCHWKKKCHSHGLKETFALWMSGEASVSLQASLQDCISRLEKVNIVLHCFPKCVSSQSWDSDTTVTSASYSRGKALNAEKLSHHSDFTGTSAAKIKASIL